MDDPSVWSDDEWDPDGGLGLDLKLGLSSELTLDLTVNPDFAQVEIDDQVVNLTRFPLYFPEKREFFLEKANLFRFGPPYNQLFYSRRIGLDDEGETLPIYYGARITGKVGSTEIGAFDMLQGSRNGIPERHFDVVRLKQDIGRSSVGGIFSRRGSGDGLAVLRVDAALTDQQGKSGEQQGRGRRSAT